MFKLHALYSNLSYRLADVLVLSLVWYVLWVIVKEKLFEFQAQSRLFLYNKQLETILFEGNFYQGGWDNGLFIKNYLLFSPQSYVITVSLWLAQQL